MSEKFANLLQNRSKEIRHSGKIELREKKLTGLIKTYYSRKSKKIFPRIEKGQIRFVKNKKDNKAQPTSILVSQSWGSMK